MAQFRALEAFAQFGSDLDKATQSQLNRGRHLVEILKQDQYEPLPFSKQVLILYAGTTGAIDDLPAEQVREFERELYKYAETMSSGTLQAIGEKKTLDDALKAELTKLINEFKEKF